MKGKAEYHTIFVQVHRIQGSSHLIRSNNCVPVDHPINTISRNSWTRGICNFCLISHNPERRVTRLPIEGYLKRTQSNLSSIQASYIVITANLYTYPTRFLDQDSNIDIILGKGSWIYCLLTLLRAVAGSTTITT